MFAMQCSNPKYTNKNNSVEYPTFKKPLIAANRLLAIKRTEYIILTAVTLSLPNINLYLRNTICHKDFITIV